MSVSVQLKATPVARLVVRASVLGDLMTNFGFPADVVEIGQRGYAARDICGVSIYGYDHNDYIADKVTLKFDELTNDDKLAVDTSNGRSMIEALSIKFAHAVSYSVSTMRRKGLRIDYAYHFYPGRMQNGSRYGLVTSNDRCAPGYAMREVFSVRPGMDPGISYSHASARRVK